MSPRLPASGAAVVGLGLACYVTTAGLDAFVGAVAAVGAAGVFLRHSIDLPRALLLPLALVLLLGLLAVPAELPPASAFVGVGSYRVATVLALACAGFLLRRNTPGQQLGLVCLALALSMASGMTTRLFPFGALVAVQGLAAASYFRTFLPGAERGFSPARLAASAALLVTALATAVFLMLSERTVGDLMSFLEPDLSYPLRFGKRAELDTIENRKAMDRVTMRVFSDNPPVYLVGTCYTVYVNRGWENPPGLDPLDPVNRPSPSLGFPEDAGSVFELAPPEEEYERYLERIELSSASGGSLFVPRGLERVALPAARLQVGPGEVLYFPPTPPGGRFRGIYYVLRRSAGRTDTGALRPEYLQLPEGVPPILLEEAARLGEGTGSPREVASQIERYFHEDGFRYGRGHKLDRSRDPVEEFLADRPPVHCEFFATAMTLMLRAQGVPSRYLNGYIVQERNDLGRYHVVREKHAHAWVEAYIEGSGWEAFDPTPPDAVLVPVERGWMARLREIREWLGYQVQRARRLAGLSPRELFARFLTLLQGGGQWLTEHPLVVVVLLVLLGLERLLRGGSLGLPWARGRRQLLAPLEPMEVLLARLDGWLAERGLARDRRLTLLEWCRGLEDAPLSAEDRAAARQFATAYCSARYGRPQPTSEDFGRLEEALGSLSRDS